MRTPGTSEELEAKRRIAVGLFQQGKSRAEVARLVGTSWTSANRWKKAFEASGLEGIAAQPHPGRPPRLTAAQQQKVQQLLLRGAEKAGFENALWTAPRVATVIARQFGVKYHPSHVLKLLRQWNWSRQKPQRRAREQDRAAIEHWRTHELKRIKKGTSTSS